jgi:transcriptional regulator with XRE-family HTH domain
MANLDICVRFGRRVQRERMQRNLKQIDLSVATGMTRSTISQIENGRQEAGLRTVEKLAKALEMPIVSLFRNL